MKLHPESKPYRKGYLKTGEGHEIYYELSGNQRGKPVLFVHGGPGGGCSPSDACFFSPRKFNVIFFDQRGAGRSRPSGSTKANTTPDLVRDMQRLLKHLGIRKVFLFGSSWGSTLSLAYAVKHPETVSGMLLCGVFLGTRKEIMQVFGGGAKQYFPDAWERFESMAPKKERGKILDYYVRKMKSKNKMVRKRHVYEWGLYELSMVRLAPSPQKIKKILRTPGLESMYLLEAHYMKNNCFLADGYLLKKAGSLKVPVTIVQGRYDVITPPQAAWKLHKALPRSKLVFTTAGHGSGDQGNAEAIMEELKKLK